MTIIIDWSKPRTKEEINQDIERLFSGLGVPEQYKEQAETWDRIFSCLTKSTPDEA